MTNVVALPKKREPAFEAVPAVSYLKRHRATGIYYVRKEKKGRQPLFKSTGEDKIGRARTRADLMIAEWLGEKPRQAPRRTVATLCDELQEVLRQEYENRDRRQRTWDHDRTYLPIIKRLFGDYFPDQIDEEFWEDWARTKGRRLGRSTLFDVSKYLSKVLTYAFRRKLIGRKPQIRDPDPKSKKGRVLPDWTVALIVRNASPLLLAQIVLGYECGFRTGEVRGLRWDWITWEQDGLATVNLPEWYVKANARKITLSPKASEMLRARGAEARRSPYVFPAARNPARMEQSAVQNRRWRKTVQAARAQALKQGLEWPEGSIWFYHLRHTFYNRALLEFGLPIAQVSEYGGTSITTLQNAYLKTVPERTRVVSQTMRLPEEPENSREKSVNKGEDNGEGR